jgi:hypothetical protein
MDKGDPQAVRARVKALQEEIAPIREADRLYRTKLYHRWQDMRIHEEQSRRLEQILEELASLSRDTIPRTPRDTLNKRCF